MGVKFSLIKIDILERGENMIVNGKSMELGNKRSVMDLINELNLNPQRIVIEIDKEILPKEMFETCKLEESSVVEVISFVGGG